VSHGRRRRRYLKIAVRGDHNFVYKDVAEVIQKSVLNLYGVEGLSRAEPKLIDFDEEDLSGILRCNHFQLDNVRAALAHVTNIEGTTAAIRVLNVSGTIKSLKRKTTPSHQP
jgi:RNase P/RNase MRP subunit POP5